jgi:hypothetical protein
MTRAALLAASVTMWAAVFAPPAWGQAVVPDPTLTHGAVRTTDVFDVCEHGTRQLRHMTRDRSDAIMVEYGLPLCGPRSKSWSTSSTAATVRCSICGKTQSRPSSMS